VKRKARAEDAGGAEMKGKSTGLKTGHYKKKEPTGMPALQRKTI